MLAIKSASKSKTTSTMLGNARNDIGTLQNILSRYPAASSVLQTIQQNLNDYAAKTAYSCLGGLVPIATRRRFIPKAW